MKKIAKFFKDQGNLAFATKDVERSIIKGTNRDKVAPKEKHVLLILREVKKMDAEYDFMLKILTGRLTKKNYIIVFKSLIFLHRLMIEGDRRFMREFSLKQQNAGFFGLSRFKDLSSPDSFDYCEFIRNYSSYLEEKQINFREISFSLDYDLETISAKSPYRKCEIARVLKEIPSFQSQLDLVFLCDPSTKNTSPIFAAALALLIRDSTRLFKTIYEGISNILDVYFKLNENKAKKALEMTKKFKEQVEKLSDFSNKCGSPIIEGEDDLKSITNSLKRLIKSLSAQINNGEFIEEDIPIQTLNLSDKDDDEDEKESDDDDDESKSKESDDGESDSGESDSDESDSDELKKSKKPTKKNIIEFSPRCKNFQKQEN
eukprot:Anaeramoba_ignava/c18990_g1_i3.p1 GENE.c18990_g1_i3~~c18990_g1_i3.p1  ORF type:complete len:374 (+),score=135.30 c18990_g1_i3:6-1127(+)